jgi:hypothetical protein
VIALALQANDVFLYHLSARRSILRGALPFEKTHESPPQSQQPLLRGKESVEDHCGLKQATVEHPPIPSCQVNVMILFIIHEFGKFFHLVPFFLAVTS